jgi:hypothetical protein
MIEITTARINIARRISSRVKPFGFVGFIGSIGFVGFVGLNVSKLLNKSI